MPETINITRTLYKFEELDEGAKERARAWYRDGDDFFTEYIYEDANTIASLMGIEIDRRAVKLMGGGTRYEPTIWWSGFWSQGDGACFEGTYRYRKGSVVAVKAHAPQDETLHRIVERLQAAQKPFLYKLCAKVVHRGHYYHSRSVDITVTHYDDEYRDIGSHAEEEVSEALRDFMDWIYDCLEKEYEYQNSDEVVDENIIGNEYTFDQHGHRLDAGDV